MAASGVRSSEARVGADSQSLLTILVAESVQTFLHRAHRTFPVKSAGLNLSRLDFTYPMQYSLWAQARRRLQLESRAVTLMMKETSTLGLRVGPLSRYEAERETIGISTSLGNVQVKVKRLEGKTVSVAPEYEDCRRIAIEKDMTLQDVYRIVQRAADENLLNVS